MVIHVVRAGETLGAIAAEYGVDAQLLAAENGLDTAQTLVIGQTLVVRWPQQMHTVRAGETLGTIAAAYGVSVNALWRRNFSLQGRSTLQPGQRLVIAYEGAALRSADTNGYAYPQIAQEALRAQLPYLTYLTPFSCGITAQGRLLPADDGALRSAAAEYGVLPLMHLSTLTESGAFDSARPAALLRDEAAQSSLADEIEQALAQRGYRGLDIDFEYVPAELREAYAAFVRMLRVRLNARGLPVMTALAPKTRADQPGLLYEAHDYALLGEAANAVLLMTYEWGYTYGPPMAVAPLPQVREVVRYAVAEVAREKIFLGVPTYGYDWALPFEQGVSRAQSLSPQEAVALARRVGAEIRFDETARAPWFSYFGADGREHTVWFEDARSALAKLMLVEEFGLHGVGYWNLMRDFPQGWAVLDALFRVAQEG